MKTSFALRGGAIALSLLAAAGFAGAADQASGSAPPARQAHHRHFDPVQRTQLRLDALAGKLNLKNKQKAAWQIYADSTLARAQERAARMQEGRAHRHDAQRNADTASRLERMAQPCGSARKLWSRSR